MKIRPLFFALLLLTGAVRGAPPPMSGTWEPLPPDVAHDVIQFFTQWNAAMAGGRMGPVMALYAEDATEAIQVGANSRMAVPDIMARRRSEMRRLAESRTAPEAVDAGNLRYQARPAANEFLIRRLMHKPGAAADDAPSGMVFYYFRREGSGLVIVSTLSQTLETPRAAPAATASMPRRMLLGPDGLPTEIELVNGLRLRDAVVLNWQRDGVLIKHVAGTDPIKFERIIPEQRALFEAQLAERLRQQTLASYASAAAARNEDNLREVSATINRAQTEQREQQQEYFESEVGKHHLQLGMTMDQVRRSWGYPTTSNPVESGDGHSVLWIYEMKGVDEHGNACNAGVGLRGDFVTHLYNVKNR